MRFVFLAPLALVAPLALGGCNAGGQAAVQAGVGTAQDVANQALSALNTACTSVNAAVASANQSLAANPNLAGAGAKLQNLEAYASSACTKAGATGGILAQALNDPTKVQATVNWVLQLAPALMAIFA